MPPDCCCWLAEIDSKSCHHLSHHLLRQAAMMITDEQMGMGVSIDTTQANTSWNYSSTDDDVWAVVCGSHLDLSTDVPIINIKTFFFLLLMCVQ